AEPAGLGGPEGRDAGGARATVSIVLLSYNRPAMLRAALDSLMAQTYRDLDILVVDNPSPASEEIARLVGSYAGVALLRNAENVGYAGGMNRGIERASGRYVYLTEDDIVLERDCVRRLVEHARADPSKGLLAPLIYNTREGTIRCAGGGLSLGGVFSNEIYGAGERDRGQFADAFDVEFIAGSTIFAELEFLRRTGGFREDFFMYSEDRELCLRVAKSGYRLKVVPGAKVYHFEPEEAAVSPELQFHIEKNFYALYLLHAPVRVWPEFFCRYVLLRLVRSGRHARTLLRAWWWVLRNANVLLRGRGRVVTPARAGEGGWP
ncbi:MAG: glycosyltransferase family 2 protein, partial [Acidobacteriota bacterium]|nr:glycosyltransferase family 2 protein [Acidobacteriota bacterium]